MIIAVNDSGHEFKFDVRKVGNLNKGIGLMFKSKENDNLLFEFKKDTRISIHSFFVFFIFLAVWLDEENRVLEKRIVTPFKINIKPVKKFRKLIEIPVNSKNAKIIKFFVGK